MDWDQQVKLKSRRKKGYLERAVATFDEAAKLAKDNSWLLEKMPAEYHFQLAFFDKGCAEFIYNLYPTTQKIYSDPKHLGPFLKVVKPWTLLDVVKAAVKNG
ncbi:hypothetical protein ES703_62881 [subsurface metagenome]